MRTESNKYIIILLVLVIFSPLILKYIISHKCLIDEAKEKSTDEQNELVCTLDKYGGFYAYTIISLLCILFVIKKELSIYALLVAAIVALLLISRN